MTELQDLSKLPDDAAYWDALEARVLENATPLLRKAANARPDVWAPLAERAGALGGLAFAAALAAILLMPPRPLSRPAASGLLRIPQDDPTMAAFLASPEPPPVVTLVLPDSRRQP